jgi:hypothetical protein
MLQLLPATTRRVLAGILLAAGLAYGILLATTFFQTAAPSQMVPDLAEIKRLLFPSAKPISPLERRLVMSDTPLGTGPLITGQTGRMPPLNESEALQREGDRQALLDWIRSGASRTSYEQDDHTLTQAVSSSSITPKFLRDEGDCANSSARRHLRVRSLFQERCLSCHAEDGDDTARLIPFDSYDAIARYLIPESHGDTGRAWLFASLALLFPLAGVGGLTFACTSHPFRARILTLAVTLAALAAVAVCWSLHSPWLPVLLIAAAVAATCSMLQILASALELLGLERSRFPVS